MHAKSLQLCLTLYDSVDCRMPGSSVHGIAESNMTEGTLHNASLFQAVKIASDSPGGQVVKNLPANAGDTGSIVMPKLRE